MRWIVIAAVLAGLSCASGGKVRSLEYGMTEAQVVRTMGKPDGRRRDGDSETLVYTNRLVSGFAWDRADYEVVLREGRVVEYGATEVRQAHPRTGTVILVPAPK